MSRPISTYRLQLTPDFGFAQVGEIAAYLRDLGVSHVYLSPILQAKPASAHGYDVTDHSRIRAEFGGAQGLRELAGRLAAHDLAVVLDLVPNHMDTANRWFRAVLRDGPASPYARWFDLHWNNGEIALPVLAAGAAEPRPDGDVLRYHEHEFPHPGHYRLVPFTEGPGYRRFFDVSSLIGLRVEEPEVLFATHEVIFWLLDEGLAEGLRVDHPDGLADPRGYLERLRERSGGVWTVVEKILIGEERLPGDWACDGTTGYDVLNRVNGLFVDPAGARPLTESFTRFTGQRGDYPEVVRRAKHQVIELFFGAELSRLAAAAGCDPAVVGELLVAMPVYRAYVVPGEDPPPHSVAVVEAAARRARAALPEERSAELARLVRTVLYGPAAPVTAFQQLCGPVMAKGVEDTALYRWYPLACLNEVGGEPDRFGWSVGEFHDFCADLRPHTMTTLSTHDTKRSEDVRARLSVLSELPEEWAEAVARWSRVLSFDPQLDYLAWQDLVGAWPISAERFADHLLKAAREAKLRTSWIAPDAGYEEGVREFAAKAVTMPVGEFVATVDEFAPANSVGAKVVQLMMPGVPDVYQGNETTDFSLVDPDNRRPVAFPRQAATEWDALKLLVTGHALRLRRRLGDAAPYRPLYASGEAAGHVIAFARGGHDAHFRRNDAGAGNAEGDQGDTGDGADGCEDSGGGARVHGYARAAAVSIRENAARGSGVSARPADRGVGGGDGRGHGAVVVATRLPAGLARRGGWGATTLTLPAGLWQDLLTANRYTGRVPLAHLLARHPVALLERHAI
ncbi:malto-oligosyltrehalose synthase [Nonomuraea longicatena]|uniref:Malto-oligosyltrehalose synthase n=1 Tax=Nonomuraea longicatena TaxID=83682 RepID=A0ABN1QIX7_9ACTN